MSKPSDKRIDYAGSVHGEEEIAAVVDVLSGSPTALRIGKHVRKLEQLVARLAQEYDLSLAQTLAFDYPTPRTLAHHLYGLLHPDQAAAVLAGAAVDRADRGAAPTGQSGA